MTGLLNILNQMILLGSAEKVSGLELDWYLLDWAQSTMTIDYSINSVLLLEKDS